MISARLPGEGLTLGRCYPSAAAAPAPEFLPPAPPPPAAPTYPPAPAPGPYARFLSHAHGTHTFAYASTSVPTAVAASNAYRGAPYVAPPRARTSPGFAPPALSPSNHRRIAVERAHTERLQAERAQVERAQTERTQTERAHADRASPEYFKRGALIRLEGGALRRVEEMRTEDFVASAERNSALTLSECTVLRLEERGGSLAITLSYNHNRSQVEMETTPEHPFFVYGQGWASCNPTRTLALYDLHVRRLRVGDVCVSLVQRAAGAAVGQAEAAPPPPPQTQLCRNTTCPTTATGTAVSARLQTPLRTNQNPLQHNSLQSSHCPQQSSQGLLLASQSSLHALHSSLHTSQNTLHTSQSFFHTSQGPPLYASHKSFLPPLGPVHNTQGLHHTSHSAQGTVEAIHRPFHSSPAHISRLEPLAVQCYPENLSTKEDSRKRRWSAPDKCDDEPPIGRKR